MSLPRYPKYKDSGVECLGDVPEHWTVDRFKWQISRNDGGVWGDEPDGVNDTVVLRSTDQTVDGRWQLDAPAFRRLTADEVRGSLLAEGDLLVTKSSGSALHIGKTTLVTPEIASMGCCFSNFMQRIRLRPSFLAGFAWHLMNNEVARGQMSVLSNSTTGLANLNGTIFGQLVVPVPPRDEQLAITHFLNLETSKIDALIAEQERLVELLKEKRQAVISQAVTNGLNPDAPMKPSGADGFDQVPTHWEVSRMTRVAQMESGHTPDKKVPAYWEGGDIPWVSLNDTGFLKDHDYIADTAYQITPQGIANSSAHLLPARSVVLSRDATIGRCAITVRPMAVSQHFIAWVCSERLRPEYLLLRLRSMTNELDRLATGATVKTIGMPEVRTLVTPVPPTDEQDAIVAFAAAETAMCDELATEARLGIALLQERRAALILSAVTGQIDVRTLAPESIA